MQVQVSSNTTAEITSVPEVFALFHPQCMTDNIKNLRWDAGAVAFLVMQHFPAELQPNLLPSIGLSN